FTCLSGAGDCIPSPFFFAGDARTRRSAAIYPSSIGRSRLGKSFQARLRISYRLPIHRIVPNRSTQRIIDVPNTLAHTQAPNGTSPFRQSGLRLEPPAVCRELVQRIPKSLHGDARVHFMADLVK